MPRPLDFFVPCRTLDKPSRPSGETMRPARDAAHPSVDAHHPSMDAHHPSVDVHPSVDAHHPWRTPSGTLVSSEHATRPVPSARLAQPSPAKSRRAPAGRPVASRRKPDGGRRALKNVLRGAAIVTVAGVVGTLAAFPSIRQAAAAALPGNAPEDVFGRDHVRLLLLGADRDYDESGRRLTRGGRTDTLILADLDMARHSVHLCSIPRDTEAEIPGRGTRRINSAYASGGADLARRSVEGLTGLPIDHTVVINLDGFKEAVDALGGVEVEVDRSLRYTDHWAHLDINIPAGLQRLDGEHAMQFVRFRHDALADIGRARRQQAFMRALGQAMRRPGAIVAWPGVVRAVSRHTETDLTPAQMVALGRFAKDMGGMTTETLPGSFHRSRWRPDPEGVRRMAARLSE